MIVANDPKIAFSTDEAVDTTANESENSKSNEPLIPDKADSPSAVDKQGSNRKSPWVLGRLPSTPSDTTDQKLPINELRAQAENSVPLDTQVNVEDAEELIHRVATSLKLVNGQDIPDFGSDDSDGPPSDEEFAL